MFDLEVSYPAIEPPHYLIALNPGVFEAEQARVRERFEAAVEMAEQAFATELERHGTSGRATHGASGRRAEGLPRYRHHELHGVLRAVPAAERPQQPRSWTPWSIRPGR